MRNDLDPDISRWLTDAASQIDPSPDLRSRADQRARKQATAARVGFGVTTTALVLAIGAVAMLSISSRMSDGPTESWNESSASGAFPMRPVDWSTAQVAFRADGVLVTVRGTTFGASEDRAQVHSDPGTATYTTLERRWFENGVEMRVNFYFKSDGVEWWSDEIRTYDGAPGRGTTWVTYRGDFFRSPVGQPFVGDIELPGAAQSIEGLGELIIRGAEILPFRPTSSCTVGTSQYSLDVVYPDVTIEGDGFSVRVKVLDANCTPIDDLSPFEVTFSPVNNEVVASVPTCPPEPGAFATCRTAADLRPVTNGETEVTVDVRRVDDGTSVASGSIHVLVDRP